MNEIKLHFLEMVPPNKAKRIRICLMREVSECNKTIKAAEGFNVPVVISDTGEEYLNDDTDWKTYFVLKEFHGDTFDNLTKYKQRYFILLFL